MRTHVNKRLSASCQNVAAALHRPLKEDRPSVDESPFDASITSQHTSHGSRRLRPDCSVAVNLDDSGWNGSAVAAPLTQISFSLHLSETHLIFHLLS